MAAISFADVLLHPPVLFFALGIFASLVRSDLKIPNQISKFLALYLMFHIGFQGGGELLKTGLTADAVKIIVVCVLFSFLVPFGVYGILRRKVSNPDAAAIAATYGSISAVTFATAISFLESHQIQFGGYMVAAMALMESPAIVAGLLLFKMNQRKQNKQDNQSKVKVQSKRKVFHEACFNGSVVLLIGSLLIGLLSGEQGLADLDPFVNDIFKGMLSLYMLDMGTIAARRFQGLKDSGFFLIGFALIYPLFGSALGIMTALLLGLPIGDALLLTVLTASASYIAVPAAMRTAIPRANMSLLLPMALGLTFSFNVIFGIPLYYGILQMGMSFFR